MSLQVKVVNALLTRDVGSVSQMDPYVKLHLGNQKFCTSVDKNAGKKPKWNQLFKFDSFNLDKNFDLKLYIMDQGSVTDTLIAGRDINLKQIVQNAQKNGSQQIFDVMYDGKSVGKIMLKIQSSLGAHKASNIQTKEEILLQKIQDSSQKSIGNLKELIPGQTENKNQISEDKNNPLNIWGSIYQGKPQLMAQHVNNFDPNIQNGQQNYHQSQYQQSYVPQTVMYNPQQQYVNYPPQQQYYAPQPGYAYMQPQVGYLPPPQNILYQQQVVYTNPPNYSQNPLNNSLNSWSQPKKN